MSHLSVCLPFYTNFIFQVDGPPAEGSQKGETSRPPSILKKSMLKSMSTGSVDKGGEGKPQVRTTSPIPEDPREDDAAKSPPGKTVNVKAPEAKKVPEIREPPKEGDQKEEEEKKKKEEEEKKKKEEERKKKEEEEKKKKEAEEKKKKEEEEKKKKEAEEKKKKEEKKPESSDPPPKPAPQEDTAPVATTKLRGKSKATGQIMGGWI